MKIFLRRSFLLSLFLMPVICPKLKAQQISTKQALFLIKQNSSFLNLSTEDIANSVISDAYFDRTSNTFLIYLQQTYNGIPVYHAIQVIALKKEKAISVSGKRIAKIEEKITGAKEEPPVAARRSVSVAARILKLGEPASLVMLRSDAKNHRVEFSSSTISRENIKIGRASCRERV